MTTAAEPEAILEPIALEADRALVGATVLVVDDHQPNLVLVEKILTKAGVSRVHTTGDPADVVRVYCEVHPDLVILDLHMPGMDGVEVMQAMRDATPRGEFVPVIVLTADATTKARDRVLSAGANDFLTKPVDRTEVVLRVRNLLHSRALHARLHKHNMQLEMEIASRRAADERARALMTDKARRVQEAIDRGAPRMVFQPIAVLSSSTIVGYEALARFDGEPARPPEQWFAEAAEVGQGPALELAAIEGALRHLASVPPGAFLTLNVSPTTACTPQLAALLVTQPMDRLVLEITEHVRVDDYVRLLDSLGRLRRGGLRLAVDDAGAGFASLHHTLQLQPDIIKLDISLTRDIDGDPVKRALASSLVTFSHEIGAILIAEGIETGREQQTLVDLGVPWGQGFFLGIPDVLPLG
jgi:EAL domain-containing protein (putative c-di-GMP-specific phosphodiesterase class I)/ActR/RegA family two-component response regulator